MAGIFSYLRKTLRKVSSEARKVASVGEKAVERVGRGTRRIGRKVVSTGEQTVERVGRGTRRAGRKVERIVKRAAGIRKRKSQHRRHRK